MNSFRNISNKEFEEIVRSLSPLSENSSSEDFFDEEKRQNIINSLMADSKHMSKLNQEAYVLYMLLENHCENYNHDIISLCCNETKDKYIRGMAVHMSIYENDDAAESKYKTLKSVEKTVLKK